MPSRLCLKNTLTDRKEIFKPREKDGPVKIFTCGPSIYSWPHIGNYRTFLFEDVLQRYLDYLGYPVQRLINFTDVEDKAVDEARRREVSLKELTEPVAERFFKECRLLRIALPESAVSRSSTSIDQAVHLIQRLLDKGIAYRHGKNIYYDPLKFKGFGKLYGLDMSRWPEKKVRFHKDTYPGHRWNLGDFVLWMGRKKNADGDIYWETELGKGRPSWNVQDPAMITKHLGYRIDISCGGIDNLYRHHDYNIAVIEGVSGKKFANYWLHGEHVLVDGLKMSKSRGNIVYVEDVLANGFAPRHLRFYLIYGHYRQKIDLNRDHLHLARGRIDTFCGLAAKIADEGRTAARSQESAPGLIRRLATGFEERMNDDLDVKGAFDSIYDTVEALAKMAASGKLSKKDRQEAARSLARIDGVLQVMK
ncbi:MAG: class I tRNA ligase family protein [Desulfobacterales bacterium]|nr:class I tRNA ligase family protein [Desulfobacterales bacterium]